MLHILDPDEYDIAAIQEPYLDHTHNSRASPTGTPYTQRNITLSPKIPDRYYS